MEAATVKTCLFFSTFIMFWISMLCAKFEFTNLKCVCLSPAFCTVEICKIKAVNRTYKYLSVKVNLHEKNINNITVRFRLMKKANDYKPFLYDITCDACEFLRHPNNPVVSFIYNFFRDYSNINHTCPFNGAFIVDKLPTSHVGHQMSAVLPFPAGEYALYVTWIIRGIPSAEHRVYVALSD